MSLLMFLMAHRWLRPGWDWLVSRKLSSFWREVCASPLEAGMGRFCDTATAVGFTLVSGGREPPPHALLAWIHRCGEVVGVGASTRKAS